MCALVIAALVGSAVVAVTATAATPSTSDSATALIAGTVVGPNGVAAADAIVSLIAWPTPEHLSELEIGDAVSTEVISTTSATSAGRYSFTPNLGALGPDYVTPDGSVNLELDATAGGSEQQWSIPAALPGSAASTSAGPSTAVQTSRPASVDFDMYSDTLTEEIGATPAHTSSIATVPAPEFRTAYHASDVVDGVPPEGFCSAYVKYRLEPNRQEEFLNLYTFSGHAQVTETLNSTHSLGVSLALSKGGWEVDGSANLEKDTSAGGEDSYTNNVRLSNAVNAEEYQQTCTTFSDTEEYHYMQRPDSFNQFLTAVDPINPIAWNASNCYRKTSGSYWKTQGSNQDFAHGFKTPFIEVGSQAAYSQQTSVRWYPGSEGEWLCGSTSAGFLTSPFAGGTVSPAGGGGCGVTPMGAGTTTAPRNPDVVC